MIANLKPYPAMKDSGVPRLGKVPEHWEVETLGRFGHLFKGNGASRTDEVRAPGDGTGFAVFKGQR